MKDESAALAILYGENWVEYVSLSTMFSLFTMGYGVLFTWKKLNAPKTLFLLYLVPGRCLWITSEGFIAMRVHGMTSQRMQLEIFIARHNNAGNSSMFACIQTFANDLFTPQKAI